MRWFLAHNILSLYCQYILIRCDFWAHNSLMRSYFERTIVWTMVWVWTGAWSRNRLDNGLILLWSEVLFVWNAWSEKMSSALGAHKVFRALFSLIREYFGLGWSDQWLLSSGTVWSDVTLGWHLNLGCHSPITSVNVDSPIINHYRL